MAVVATAADLTFGQVGAERGLRLLAVGHQLSGEEVHLCDLGGSQTLHPAAGKARESLFFLLDRTTFIRVFKK